MAEQTFSRIDKTNLREMETVNGASCMTLETILRCGRCNAFKGRSSADISEETEKKHDTNHSIPTLSHTTLL
jgi:hypothetical protein